jgi:hypothetical protein
MKIESPKIILLHPGKTGGTSIEHTLRDKYLPNIDLNSRIANRDIMFGIDKTLGIYLQHSDIPIYKNLGINLSDYKTICTVRRPYERIISSYFYNGKSKLYGFKTFVLYHLERLSSNKLVNHFSPQLTYFKYGDYTVDHIIKLENITEDSKAIGINVKYHYSKTIGTSKIKNVMDMYDEQTKDIVYNLYKEDFELLGYEK